MSIFSEQKTQNAFDRLSDAFFLLKAFCYVKVNFVLWGGLLCYNFSKVSSNCKNNAIFI